MTYNYNDHPTCIYTQVVFLYIWSYLIIDDRHDNWNKGKVVLPTPVMLYLSTRSLCVHYCIYFHQTDRIA